MKELRKNLLTGFAVAVWFGFFAWMNFDAHHDGVMLGAAALAAEGKLLFKEVFSQYGPLAIWIQAAACRIFGAEDLVIKLLTVLFYCGIYLLADHLYAPRLSGVFRWLWRVMFFGLCGFYLAPFHPWSSVYALFFMLLAAHFMLKYLEKEQMHALFRTGVFSAAAWLCRTPCGFVPLVAAVLTLLLCKAEKRCYGKLFGGFFLIAALFGFYLIAAGAAEDYFRQCGSFIFRFVIRRGGRFQLSQLRESFFPFTDSTGYGDAVFAVLPLIALGFLAVLLYRKERNTAFPAEIFLTLFALGSWHQYFPVPCVRHLYWAGIPLFGITALAAQTLWNSSRTRGFKLTLTIPCVILLLAGLTPRFIGIFRHVKNWHTRTVSEIPGLRHLMLFRSENEVLSMLCRAWNRLPPELKMRGVLNHTPDGLYSVMFPAAQPPTPMFVNWGRDVYPDYPEIIEKFIREKRPVVLTTDYASLPGYIEICNFNYFETTYRLLAPLE